MTVTTPSTERPAIEEMYVVHRVFRREFTSIPTLIRGVADGDTGRARIVADHLELVLGGLHMHHTGEDAVLWPRLLERARLSTALVETMQEQHEGVDAYLDQIAPVRADWSASASPVRGEELARLIEDFAGALFEHLDLEEREILPLVTQHITVAEWKSLGEHGSQSVPKRLLPILFGSILEDANAQEREMMLRVLPAPIRLGLRLIGGPVYRRYINRVRAA